MTGNRRVAIKSLLATAAAILGLVAVNPASAALAVGDAAPAFTAPGAQGGTMMTVDLAALLKQGPVVIFFFPSAFTEGPECREFAENIDKFRAAGASVVGMSRDSVDTLSRFSTDQCDGKIPMASASETIVNGFDVNDGAMFNTRTSFVIDAAGRIAFVHDEDDYSGHMQRTLAFVQGMKRQE